MIKRRQFITGLGSTVAWPVVAGAQQPALPVVGFVSLGSADSFAGYRAAFRQGLGETGYVEGQNVAVDACALARFPRAAGRAACANCATK
jgi:putative ABC transport system substrate-binding protein